MKYVSTKIAKLILSWHTCCELWSAEWWVNSGCDLNWDLWFQSEGYIYTKGFDPEVRKNNLHHHTFDGELT